MACVKFITYITTLLSHTAVRGSVQLRNWSYHGSPSRLLITITGDLHYHTFLCEWLRGTWVIRLPNTFAKTHIQHSHRSASQQLRKSVKLKSFTSVPIHNTTVASTEAFLRQCSCCVCSCFHHPSLKWTSKHIVAVQWSVQLSEQNLQLFF